MTIWERIDNELKRRKLSWAWLHQQLDVTKQAAGHWRNRGIPQKYFREISIAIGRSIDWIEFGDLLPDGGELEVVSSYPKVPLISWVQAGMWADIQDNFHPGEADEWISPRYSNANKHAYALKVTGMSMCSPFPTERSFQPGTIIIVDPEQSAGPNDFVIAKDIDTQQATFKQLMLDGGRWYLRPINPSFPTIEIDDPSIRVIGKVVEFQPPGGKL